MQGVALLGVRLTLELHHAGMPSSVNFHLISKPAEIARPAFHAALPSHTLHAVVIVQPVRQRTEGYERFRFRPLFAPVRLVCIDFD